MVLTTFLPAVVVLLIVATASLLPWNRLAPRRALWLSTGMCVAAATAVAVTLSVLVGGFLLGVPPGRRIAEACLAVFVDHHRIPTPAGLASLPLATIAAKRVHGVLARRADLDVPDEALTVVDEAQPIAFAVGRRQAGGVVVSTGMLDVLDEGERRVLFAHERAHLDQRHERFLLAAAITVAIVPGARRLADQVRLATERCADEAAVGEVCGDRRLVARSIARAALAVDDHVPAMAFTGSTVGYRVRDLLGAETAPSTALYAAIFAASVGVASGGAVFAHHLVELVLHLCS